MAFRPRPEAMPIGKRPMTPIRIVITPATTAVAAATMPIDWLTAAESTMVCAASVNFGAPDIRLPSLSAAVPMISGFSARM